MEDTIAQRYKIIKTLGSGGFGDTFLAQDLQMPSGRQVVIKKLKPFHQNNISIELIQGLFEREAKVLEELGQNCSQIPTLYAYFTENEEFYLVQEYIEGKSLAELGAISSAQCESILSSLLNTLKYIHSKNIIHRDIKPENIIIRDFDKLPVLIDFGAVKESMGAVSLSSGSSISSVIVGTRGFIPPEQTTGRTVFSSDLYALSLTMIYSLTGKYPIEIPNNNITGELDWQSYIPNLPSNLRLVLEKASKIDLNQRYPTSQAMYEALHMSQINTVAVIPQKSPINFTKEKEVIEPSPVIPYSVNSSQNNNNLIIAIVTGLFVALGVLGGFFILQNMNQTQEKLAEIEQEKQKNGAKLQGEKTINSDTDLIGTWEGTFINVPNSQLIIENQSGNFFSGTLITKGKEGKIYHLAVEGDINPNTNKIIIREVQVLSKPSSGIWYLGINTGIFSVNENQMSGNGTDSKGNKYLWSFQRIGREIQKVNQKFQTEEKPLTINHNNNDYSELKNFIVTHYQSLNNRQYQKTWNNLTDNFVNSFSYQDYQNWWDSVSEIMLDNVDIISQNKDDARVKVDLKYRMKNGKIVKDNKPYIDLIWSDEDSQWFIDRKSN
ncbi:serine/threonine-protein kinase [Geminocystis herdmanii]|uniref:serine/threonine-protein kinase n=1 Tax=Geminocystis herdmanii TaxID=669359 RepID=UPI0003451609|nr:serine/threonine-protein kinase [Geminocystis herdmanii]